jgi:hypothetical protein
MRDDGTTKARSAGKNLENPAKIAYNVIQWVMTQQIVAFGRRLNHAAGRKSNNIS